MIINKQVEFHLGERRYSLAEHPLHQQTIYLAQQDVALLHGCPWSLQNQKDHEGSQKDHENQKKITFRTCQLRLRSEPS